MTASTGIIINANAKKIRRMRTDPCQIYREIGGDIVDVRLTSSLAELDDVLHDFKNSGIRYIGVAGGDGSLHHALTRSLHVFGPEKLPPILILKGGTMDNVSRSLVLKNKGPAILGRMVTALKNGSAIEIAERSTMQINDSYCFLFGTGFVTNFLEEAYGGKEKGLLQNIRVIRKSVGQIINNPDEGSLFRGLAGRVYADSELLGIENVRAILAGTVEHIGMGFSPLYRALEQETAFHAIITGISPRTFLKNLYRLKSGIPLSLDSHFDRVLHDIKIEAEDAFTYTMDGDLFHCDGSLTVKAGPIVKLAVI